MDPRDVVLWKPAADDNVCSHSFLFRDSTVKADISQKHWSQSTNIHLTISVCRTHPPADAVCHVSRALCNADHIDVLDVILSTGHCSAVS